jgi:hypothetical protein
MGSGSNNQIHTEKLPSKTGTIKQKIVAKKFQRKIWNKSGRFFFNFSDLVA